MPVQLLLLLTIGGVIAAWISTVVTFAIEYAAADAHRDAFELVNTPAEERGLPEYLYAAVLIQTSTGPTELVPRTRTARRLVRDQAILSHVMATIIVALNVSALLTALG